MNHHCTRRGQGGPCPKVFSGRRHLWCPACRHAEALDELMAWAEAFPGAPPDLDEDRPAWSLQQLLLFSSRN